MICSEIWISHNGLVEDLSLLGSDTELLRLRPAWPENGSTITRIVREPLAQQPDIPKDLITWKSHYWTKVTDFKYSVLTEEKLVICVPVLVTFYSKIPLTVAQETGGVKHRHTNCHDKTFTAEALSENGVCPSLNRAARYTVGVHKHTAALLMIRCNVYRHLVCWGRY